MKELVYFWERGKDETPLAGKGYKLNARFKSFHFEPISIDDKDIIHGKITYEENENYIEKFFGDNIVNLTAIVGENGSGKTQLLKKIGEMYTNDLLIFFDNEKNKFYTTSNFEIFNFQVEIEKRMKFPKIYYYSPGYTGKIIERTKNFTDISINLIAGEDFLTEEVINQINYLISENGKFVLELINIQYNEPIRIDIQYISEYEFESHKLYTSDEFMIKLIKLINAFKQIQFKSEETFNRNNFKFLVTYLSYLLVRFIIKFKNDNPVENYLRSELIGIKGKGINVFNKVLHNCEIGSVNIDDLFAVSSFIDRKDIEKGYEFTYYINNVTERFKIVYRYIQKNNIRIKEFKNFFRLYIDHTVTRDKQLVFFISNIYEISKIRPGLFKIKWIKLSYGERTFIQLFSSLYNYRVSKNQLFIMMIDEGEAGFHPEWQRLYLSILLNYFKSFKSNLQLFISTHSPLLLTDIPKGNIIFLQAPEYSNKPKSIETQTFAQNIHSILYDGFFLTNTIGEFAKKKIEELVDEINTDESKMTRDEIWKSIQLVGEPLIRKQLEELYSEKVESKNVLERRIAELENELKELKKMRDGNYDTDR